MRRLAAASVFLAVLCPLFVGCGGKDRLSASEYKAKLGALETREEKTHANVEKALAAKTVAEIKARVAAFAQAEQRLGTDLADLKPPKDAEAANDQLARGAHELADAIRAAVTELDSVTKPKAAIDLLNKRLGGAKGAQDIDAALAALKKKGYISG
jgi:hypothetical protein